MNSIITQFGADTQNLDNTVAIQNAIDSLQNGGTVVVPQGTFVCGTINLRSNVTLFLESGAILKAIEDYQKYQKNGFYDGFGIETTSFIYAESCENINISGYGTIDLSGNRFMEPDFTDEEKRIYTSEQLLQIPRRPKKRPSRSILFHNSKNIKLSGITVKDSPQWTITFNNCNDVMVDNLSIFNDQRIPHNDGIHITASKNVRISGCNIRCGDDCIAVTCIMDKQKRKSENIMVSDCILSSRSAAIRIGHTSSIVDHVLISNILMTDCNRGISIFASDNGSVNNIRVKNVIADTHIFPGGWWAKGEPIVICAANSNGKISNVSISDFSVESENECVFAGTDGNIRNIDIRDLKFVMKNTPNRVFAAEYNIEPNGKIIERDHFDKWFYEMGVSDLSLEKIIYTL